MKNNFDAVRLALALIVVFSHVGALSARPELKWMEFVFDSDFAVKGFFAISGYLVCRSYEGSSSLLDYVEKRIRRIYPAYFTVVVVCVLGGALAGTLPAADYLRDLRTWRYLLANLAFAGFLQPTLPGVFEHNHIQAVNGALWTIKVEVMLYFAVPLIVYARRRFGSWVTAIAALCLSAGWVLALTNLVGGQMATEVAHQFPAYLAYFVAGAMFGLDARWRERAGAVVAISGVLFAIVMLNGAPVRLMVEPIFYAAVVVWLATGTRPFNAGRYGDLSYGVYLVHFPIVQTLVAADAFALGLAAGVAVPVIATLVAAYVSWHLVEKRTLRRSSHYRVAERVKA